MDYVITNDITKATHWLSYEDKSYDDDFYIQTGKIGINQYYEMSYIKEEDEYFIKDDAGRYSMIYMLHNGDFIIMK